MAHKTQQKKKNTDSANSNPQQPESREEQHTNTRCSLSLPPACKENTGLVWGSPSQRSTQDSQFHLVMWKDKGERFLTSQPCNTPYNNVYLIPTLSPSPATSVIG